MEYITQAGQMGIVYVYSIVCPECISSNKKVRFNSYLLVEKLQMDCR